jgi:hypothetical protein
MIRIQLAMILFFQTFCCLAIAQQDSLYQVLVTKAGLFHLQKDDLNAIKVYKSAFNIRQPDALNAYKAAAVYALSGDVAKSQQFLKVSIDSGWTDAEWLVADPDFSALRMSSAGAWQEIKASAFAKERQYEKMIRFPDLRKKINRMTLNDQLLRFRRVRALKKMDIQSINLEIEKADRHNTAEVKDILQKYGWPKITDIGKDGQNNFWLLVQHADHDIHFQQHALREMKKLIGSGELNMENYAFLLDRVLCNLNWKQIYGTQVIWTGNGQASGFRPILREDQADQRRHKIGLAPLSTYSLGYGFSYIPLNREQAAKRDSDDLEKAVKLIDSAIWYYGRGQFQKTYDAYNNASMIAGGMNDQQNYHAAVIFAKIAADDQNPQYKSISLDFLGLIAAREKLSKTQLQDASFVVLKSESRWGELLRLSESKALQIGDL